MDIGQTSHLYSMREMRDFPYENGKARNCTKLLSTTLSEVRELLLTISKCLGDTLCTMGGVGISFTYNAVFGIDWGFFRLLGYSR